MHFNSWSRGRVDVGVHLGWTYNDLNGFSAAKLHHAMINIRYLEGTIIKLDNQFSIEHGGISYFCIEHHGIMSQNVNFTFKSLSDDKSNQLNPVLLNKRELDQVLITCKIM